jgi:hypothetical protein
MDRMASAKATKGKSRTRVLQEVSVVPSALVPSHLLMVYAPVVHQEERGFVRTFHHSSVRYSQFKVVHNKQNSILDRGHHTRWSIVPPSARTSLSKARMGILKCMCFLCYV